MKLFGYTMKPDAKAIVIAKRNGNLYIRSLMPRRVSSPKLIKSQNRFKKVSKEWGALSEDIKEKWNERAKSLKMASGRTLFMKENL